jgi:hypothetical protein
MVLPFGLLNGNNQIGKLMVKLFGQGWMDWMAIAEASKQIKIYVTHVDAHTSKTEPTHAHNDKADKLAALMTSNLTISNKAP